MEVLVVHNTNLSRYAVETHDPGGSESVAASTTEDKSRSASDVYINFAPGTKTDAIQLSVTPQLLFADDLYEDFIQEVIPLYDIFECATSVR